MIQNNMLVLHMSFLVHVKTDKVLLRRSVSGHLLENKMDQQCRRSNLLLEQRCFQVGT